MRTTRADKYFSLFIRLRDSDENGIGTCCTCGAMKPVKEMDCGHFIKRQHMATRFSEINCAVQCKRCNAFEQGRDTDFKRYLLNKYGEKIVNLLEFSRHNGKGPKGFELEIIAKEYKRKAEELAKEKHIKLW